MRQFIWLKQTAAASGITLTCFVEREAFTEGYPVYSRSLFCPVCRRIWAEVSNDSKEGEAHRPEMVSCSICNWHDSLERTVPGSILDYTIPCSGIDYGLLEALPEFLLRREFELTLKAIDN